MSIWDFSIKDFKDIPEGSRITLGEGNTPLQTLKLDNYRFFLKNENLNPSGSFKDRSLAYQLSYYLNKGRNDFVLSSSGNSAISLVSFAKKFGFNAFIFVSDKINKMKWDILRSFQYPNIIINRSTRPKSDAVKFSLKNDCINLRPSKDEHAVPGYKTIACELVRDMPEITAVIVPCSSGTSAAGIYLGFKDLGKTVKLILCQTARIHPLAGLFDNDFVKSATSLADAVVDRVMLRKDQLARIIKETAGTALVIEDYLLEQAKELFPGYTFNSLLGLAGLIKLRNYKVLDDKDKICVIAGGR